MIRCLLRFILIVFLLDVSTLGFSQGQLVAISNFDFWNDQLIDQTESKDMNQCLLIDVWTKEIHQDKVAGNFGLRFTPESDQNVYLLYQHKLISAHSKAEIGFSMNNFNALTLKVSRSFSIQDLIKD